MKLSASNVMGSSSRAVSQNETNFTREHLYASAHTHIKVTHRCPPSRCTFCCRKGLYGATTTATLCMLRAHAHTHTQEPLAGVVGGEKSQTARGYDFENRLACAGLKNRAAATAAADELWRRQYCCYNFTSGFAGGTYNRGTACDQAGTAGNRHVHVCTHHPDSGSGVHR